MIDMRWMLALAMLLPAIAAAQTASTGSLAVTATTPAPAPPVTGAGGLRVVMTGVLVDSSWKAGQVIMQLGTEGGTNKPVTYSLAAPPGGTLTGDLAIGGAPPACAIANSCLVIGPKGVSQGGKVQNIMINASQAAATLVEPQRFGPSPGGMMTPIPRRQ